MATIDQVSALISAHCRRDEDRFRSTVQQIRSSHASRKEWSAASAIERAYSFDTMDTQNPVSVPHEVRGMLALRERRVVASDMVLDRELENQFTQIVTEHKEKAKLREHDLEPMRRVLMAGPPGTGKTMAASRLAGELGLPLYFTNLHSIIGSLLGETAGRLGKLFEWIRTAQAVVLFDECDTLGSKREPGSSNAQGEMNRVMASLLTFLESDVGDCVVLCATNMPEALDPAFVRRFDAYLEFRMPTYEQGFRLIHKTLEKFDFEPITYELPELSHHDLVEAARWAAKRALLAGMPVLSDHLKEGLMRRERLGRREP